MTTLTPSAKRLITEDWRRRFPTLSVYKPMSLLRRVGPLLVGICLNRDSGNDNYKPLSYVDCLCSPSFKDDKYVERDFISLMLSHQPLKPMHNGMNRLLYVRLSSHEEAWEEQASLLEQQAYVPIEGPISINHVLEGYRRYLASPSALLSPYCYLDMVLLLAWAWRPVDASCMIDEACREMKSWPSSILRDYGGLDRWREITAEIAADPAALHAVVDRKVLALGLDRIATEDFIS